jgi:SPW repeat
MSRNGPRWQDFANLAIGIWIGLSPWLLGFAGELDAATWSALASGAAIVAFSGIDIETPSQWEEWGLIAFGTWLVVSPMLLGFADERVASMGMLVAGLAVALLAAWALLSAREYEKTGERAAS